MTEREVKALWHSRHMSAKPSCVDLSDARARGRRARCRNGVITMRTLGFRTHVLLGDRRRDRRRSPRSAGPGMRAAPRTPERRRHRRHPRPAEPVPRRHQALGLRRRRHAGWHAWTTGATMIAAMALVAVVGALGSLVAGACRCSAATCALRLARGARRSSLEARRPAGRDSALERAPRRAGSPRRDRLVPRPRRRCFAAPPPPQARPAPAAYRPHQPPPRRRVRPRADAPSGPTAL